MAVRVVQLGSERAKDEGIRIGTGRRPPRGVPKGEFARQNWYDVWFPNLAPSLETMKGPVNTHGVGRVASQWPSVVRQAHRERLRSS
jgi:uncharacterized protein YeaO (DUF488 family)